MWERIVAKVPPYRLSKFQPALPPRFEQEMLGRYLLDLEGTRRYLLGDDAQRIQGAVDLLRKALARAPLPEPELPPLPEGAKPRNEVRYLERPDDVAELCAALLREPRVGLDVETTLYDQQLCLVQFSTPAYNAVIDARALDDLTPIAEVLESRSVLKIIHNASFELGVFRRLNMGIENIFDTLPTSRRLRGRKIEGGHGLGAVCERELGLSLDKTPQASDWTRRPLSDTQVAYAAMDVEVLLPLHARFTDEMLL